ncbi:MAG TPA: ABC transporter substrate-binding protein [Rhizomicrobium sp.]|jgi:phospholipid transport system substrate-binding protein
MAILRRAVSRAFMPLFLILAFAGAPALAQGPTPAEEYIRVNVQKGLDILNDSSLGVEARREQFRAFLESLTDFHRVAMFTLGPIARTASDADKEAFATAFHAYAVAVYDKRLSHYNGQQLKVINSTEHSAGDTVVHATLTDKNGGDPTAIDFRVLGQNGQFQLMDASVEGIWLSIEERDQFVGFLGNHNNDIQALIQHLNALTADLRRK